MSYISYSPKIEFFPFFFEGSHGLIEFNLAYDESSQDVLINVIKAKVTYPTALIKYATKLAKLGCTLFYLQKLKGMDANGLSDSYCRISIVPPLGRNVRYLFIDTYGCQAK